MCAARKVTVKPLQGRASPPMRPTSAAPCLLAHFDIGSEIQSASAHSNAGNLDALQMHSVHLPLHASHDLSAFLTPVCGFGQQ